MPTITQLAQKFTSRKFLLAVAAGLVAWSEHQPLASVAVAVIYVLAEAHVDAQSVGSGGTEGA